MERSSRPLLGVDTTGLPATVISAPVRRGIAVASYEKAAALALSQPDS